MAHSTDQGLKLQLLAVALIVVLAFLHYLLWIDEGGVRQIQTLRISIQAQTEKNAELAEHNRALVAEVEDLKRGLMAIEERARSDMGMIRSDETFYRLLEKPRQAPTTNKATASAKPATVTDRPAQTVKPASPKPSIQPVKPALPVKPLAPVVKPVTSAKPPAPAAKPKPKPVSTPGASQRHE